MDVTLLGWIPFVNVSLFLNSTRLNHVAKFKRTSAEATLYRSTLSAMTLITLLLAFACYGFDSPTPSLLS
ncbi:hypothetical protein GALMADRAFT_224774 [Galerina marginata CBS 339.88]|uniref:Uncharacterized protein n=1 Tax=Galerina marginata (strain CBS 339.88) TaxID=685588 RepID=A0A067T7R7_GALM3|nr:hypothetical protein GALMADRAFT_224774 [Galerina marginata CBS 339.88]